MTPKISSITPERFAQLEAELMADVAQRDRRRSRRHRLAISGVLLLGVASGTAAGVAASLIEPDLLNSTGRCMDVRGEGHVVDVSGGHREGYDPTELEPLEVRIRDLTEMCNATWYYAAHPPVGTEPPATPPDTQNDPSVPDLWIYQMKTGELVAYPYELSDHQLAEKGLTEPLY